MAKSAHNVIVLRNKSRAVQLYMQTIQCYGPQYNSLMHALMNITFVLFLSHWPFPLISIFYKL